MYEEIFWTEDNLGNHNGVALTNVIFKNLSEHMRFRGRQDHCNAYVEDVTILQMANGDKVVSSKTIQPKPSKAACEIKPEALLNKCGIQMAVKETP